MKICPVRREQIPDAVSEDRFCGSVLRTPALSPRDHEARPSSGWRIGITFAAVLATLACAGGGTPAPTAPPATSNIIPGAEPDVEFCGEIDGTVYHCLRVTCALVNGGAGSGTETLRIDVTDRSGKAFQYTQAVSLAPGERTNITHEFDGPDFDGSTTMKCSVR